MTPTNPIEIDGHVYDRYTACLSMMVQHRPDGSEMTSVNVRLVPTRIEDGRVITADAHTIGMLAGSKEGQAPDVVAAIEAIEAAGQQFINGRGL